MRRGRSRVVSRGGHEAAARRRTRPKAAALERRKAVQLLPRTRCRAGQTQTPPCAAVSLRRWTRLRSTRQRRGRIVSGRASQRRHAGRPESLGGITSRRVWSLWEVAGTGAGRAGTDVRLYGRRVDGCRGVGGIGQEGRDVAARLPSCSARCSGKEVCPFCCGCAAPVAQFSPPAAPGGRIIGAWLI
jgi:hypothetical protein